MSETSIRNLGRTYRNLLLADLIPLLGVSFLGWAEASFPRIFASWCLLSETWERGRVPGVRARYRKRVS